MIALIIALWIALAPAYCVPGNPPTCGVGGQWTEIRLPIVRQ